MILGDFSNTDDLDVGKRKKVLTTAQYVSFLCTGIFMNLII